ncbi:UvrD-helicase domain-containing protein [Virgibacillus natechei]
MQLKNKLKLACAGSGKTWGLCQEARRESSTFKKVLMVSYTNKGVESIKKEYAKQNSGIIDSQIEIQSWYQFLLKELIRPYQSYLLNGDINKIKSFDFSSMYGKRDFSRKHTKPYFLNGNGDVKANNASELAVFLNTISNGSVIKRLEEVYSSIYIDELQDLAGRDIDLLELLLLSNIRIYCVGDYKQSTLKTHNAKANKKKSGENVFEFLETLKDSHNIQTISSNRSRRFIQDIADFSNLVYPGDDITGENKDSVEHMGVYQILRKDIKDYLNYFNPTILRFDKRTQTEGYHALNFGVSKGMTFNRVLIFPNGPLKKFLNNTNLTLNSPHKYYVGVTRPKYSLAFVADKIIEKENFVEDYIDLGNRKLKALKFTNSS